MIMSGSRFQLTGSAVDQVEDNPIPVYDDDHTTLEPLDTPSDLIPDLGSEDVCTEVQDASTLDEDLTKTSVTSLILLRHFKEGPGHWVPMIAAADRLLRSAVCAIAAKHLYRLCVAQEDSIELLRGHKGQKWPALYHNADWRYLSAKHYDEAIGRLKQAVDLREYEHGLTEKEHMLAAVTILCIYELMDAPDKAWCAHLSALPLFSPVADPVAAPLSPVVIPRTPIQGPIFWSLARQDLLCAFISETQTRLDLEDMPLWQNAGLATNKDGSLMPFSPPGSADVRTSADAEEDTKSNELTWLLGKISNQITSGDAIIPTDYALPIGHRPQIGVTQERLLERWNLLVTELRKWKDSLPETFKAVARGLYAGGDSCFASFEQIWYELPICAATMQEYHMARILMLVNQPQESTAIRSTVSARLKSYRQIQTDVHCHAREICGISLANPTDPVRANSVQSLFVAGQVFHKRHEQNAVLKLLSDIEKDLGWTTSYHRARLIDEWPRG
ncbi:hypothetical protein FZEAL_2750 [Fusarium zealandicum]|uniref:Uncharacterized protein n=1 Tax=Fusarium zealandicum TaxID=1053134 RepID=A0A8H4UQ75_9HYPO|nr:hypothetical protein FZEAL_2750 [Fusarium zealandicum]